MKKRVIKNNNILKTNQKVILTIILMLNLAMMLRDWFGGIGNISFSGTIILFNPITVFVILVILWGIWHNFKGNKNKFFVIFGILALLFIEIYYFLTWHLMGELNYFSIIASVDLAYPEFFIGIITTIILLITAISFERKYT